MLFLAFELIGWADLYPLISHCDPTSETSSPLAVAQSLGDQSWGICLKHAQAIACRCNK
jgi:hypothetical protein